MKDNICFARKDRECLALNLGFCFGKCSFYKTAEELERSKLAAFARIARLPYAQQCYIAGQYYGGKFPWRSGARA